MPQLLLEFFSEEIPARMQAKAEQDLERALMDKLSAAGLMPEGVKAFAGPRRLAAIVDGLPARTPDISEEKKGPRVGAPDQAIAGFLKSAGLSRIEDAEIVDDKKGAFYVARIQKKGVETAELIARIVPEIVRGFPWPKSMRSADQDLYWVRPLQRIVCAFDGEAVAVDLPGVACGRTTSGHRFHAPAEFEVRRFEDYEERLRKARVLVKREDRKALIAQEAKTLCAARNLELVEDAGLLEEVCGLSEWPVVLMGDMDPAFLDLPGEVIRLTMRTHQKYFAVRDPKTKKLAPHFIIVANIEAKDGGAAIAAGNARVLSARLNDARFFWEQDSKTPLFTEARREKLKQIVFHQKLGSVWDKVERVKALALELCAATGADPGLVTLAADNMKMDLVTETVGEFPELQGQIGRDLFLLREKNASVAAAIEDHYRPLGPNDRVPTDPVAITLALADKLDTLVGFWRHGEKPTGSGDAYGLRRAALGVVAIILTNGLRISLAEILEKASDLYPDTEENQIAAAANVLIDLEDFFADRLKVQLRSQGKRHDLVDAVLELGDDDLVRVAAKVEALEAFLKTDDGKNLLAGYKRAANILASEEKKDPGLAETLKAAPNPDLLAEPAERALFAALAAVLPQAETQIAQEAFGPAMASLSTLRGPVDGFLNDVFVNVEDGALRLNRLLLLSRIRDGLRAIADFSKIEG